MTKLLQIFVKKLYQTLPILWQINQNLKNKNLLFTVKLGIVGGALYYITEQGLWKSSDETTKLCNKLSTNISPYAKELTKKIPYELPSLPQSNEVSFLVKHYWNQGVKATFNFLANTPTYAGNLTTKGINAVLDNTEMKNLFVSNADTAPISSSAGNDSDAKK